MLRASVPVDRDPVRATDEDVRCDVVAATVFITRKFPPSVGGMETLAKDVWATLSAGAATPTFLVAHGGSNLLLPLWLPRATFRLLVLVLRGKVDFVLLGDVVLHILLAPLLRVLGVRYATMAMGKDIIWNRSWYQRLVLRALPRASDVLANSSATAAAAVTAGTPADRVHVVRLGVEDPQVDRHEAAVASAALRRRLGVGDDALVVLTLGRLVRRKGVVWFLRSVLPHLPKNVVYLVAGEGVDAPRVRTSVEELGLQDRVHLLGRVSDEEREQLMRGADVFVQPNIQVPGDMEGFGLVAVEAAMRGSLVVAASLEGLRDAVVDGETGVLLPSGDPDAWTRRLSDLAADRTATRELAARFQLQCRERYARENMGRELCRVLGIPVR